MTPLKKYLEQEKMLLGLPRPSKAWAQAHEKNLIIIEKLVEALEKIEDPRKRDHNEPDAYTQLGCVMHMAGEALAIDPNDLKQLSHKENSTAPIDKSKVENIRLDGVDMADSPRFTDAYIAYAEIDGVALTDAQLEELTNDHEFLYQEIIKRIY